MIGTTMLGNALRRSLVSTCLAGASALTRLQLRDGAKRDFRRVIVVASLGRDNGIAAGARLQASALASLGMEVVLLDATSALRNPAFRIRHEPGTAYVFHAGGPQTAQLIGSVLPHVASAWRIGYWAWELPDPPIDWGGCDRMIDEVWTPSSFTRDSLARLVRRRRRPRPHVVSAQSPRQRDPGAPFTVLAIADSRSSWSRKNPEGALRAFRAAFGDSRDARLLLKLGGREAELEALRTQLGEALHAPNVQMLPRRLDAPAMADLYRRADVLLSLHRAEGYGLPMNEAMAHGVPVIATGWSGNLQFMTGQDSILLPYRLVPVRDASGIYASGIWAEPDHDAAVAALRRLAIDSAFHADLSAAAHQRAASLTACLQLADATLQEAA
jgi:glycosyltransferase involved in cell wall biosynthesis